MKKRIVQVFHNLIGKEALPDISASGHNSDPKMREDTAETDSRTVSGGIDSDIVPADVRMVDWKAFERIVTESLSGGRTQGCLLLCNVDRCRDINNIYGRDAGDAVLRYVEKVLCDVFGENVCMGSPGGDGFALWLPVASKDNADDIRRQVGVVNDRLLHPAGELPPATVSVGAACAGHGEDYKSLAKRAGKALFTVKGSGRCGCEILL